MPDQLTQIAPPDNGSNGGNGGNGRRPGAPRPDTARVDRESIEETLGVGAAKRPGRTLLRRLLRWAAPVLAIAAGVLYFESRNRPVPVRYQTMTARRGDLTVAVIATGALAAQDTVDVGTEVSGAVDVVTVDYNDRVHQGETLAVVNTDLLQEQIRQAEAALVAAQANAQQTAATVAETRPQEIRAEQFFKQRVFAQQDLESAQATLARAIAADSNARAEVAVAAAALAVERTQLGKAIIRSPIDGVVLQRQIDPGRTVAASFQTPVLFVLAADLKQMTLELDVDEADVGQVRVGQRADFTVDAYPDRTFSARVRSVRNAARTVEGVVTYQAILDVTNADLALRPGMTATAAIHTAEVHNVLLVPNAALRFTPSTDTTVAPAPAPGIQAPTHRVWILRQNIPASVPITVGLSDGQWTQVLGGDVGPGTPLVTGVGEAKASAPRDSTTSRRPTGPMPMPRVR